MKQNVLISEKLTNLSYTESNHLIAIKRNDTYYSYQLTSEGNYVQKEVEFLRSNLFVLYCVVVSCALSIICVIFALYLFWKFMKQIEKLLNYIIEKKQNFAHIKKKVKQKEDVSKKNPSTNSSNSKNLKVLELSLYTWKVQDINQSLLQKDTEELQEMVKTLRSVKLTLFKIPEIYIDHISRTWTNSFREFLEVIYESPKHFPKWKLKSADNWENVSMRLDMLENKYREF